MAAKKDDVGLKVTVTKADMLEKLGACAEIAEAPTKAVLPWRAAVMLTATRDGLNLYTHSEYEWISRDVGVRPAAMGEALVYAKDLLARFAAFGHGDVQMSIDGGTRLLLKQGSARSTLPLLDVTGMPPRPTVEPHGATIGAAALSRLLSRVLPAMGSNGVRFRVGAGKAQAVATNGHVAAIAHIDGCEGDATMVIPTEAAGNLSKILAKQADGVQIAHVGRTLHVFWPGAVYASQTVTDDFPPIEAVTPTRGSHKMTADREALIAAATLVSGSTDKIRSVCFAPSSGGAAVTLSTEGENGASSQELPAACAFRSWQASVDYVMVALKFHESKEVAVYIEPGNRVDQGMPGWPLITAEGTDDYFLLGPYQYSARTLAADPG